MSSCKEEELMENGKRIAVFGLAGLLLAAAFVGVGQQVAAPQSARQTTSSAVDQVLTFVESISNYLGQGLLYVLNLITGNRLSKDLEKPIGYLALITLILVFFALIDFARKVIWIGVIIGWVLLIVRIVLDALKV
jgi:hypothetical protein